MVADEPSTAMRKEIFLPFAEFQLANLARQSLNRHIKTDHLIAYEIPYDWKSPRKLINTRENYFSAFDLVLHCDKRTWKPDFHI